MSDPESTSEPLYPNERAFVVKFRRDDSTADDLCAGHVEHVLSGRAHRFSDTEGLLNFMRQLIRPTRAP